MAKGTERTSFTKDVQGRYLCNDIAEANTWKTTVGRPFDMIVIGGGTFGAAIAEHIWFRQKQTGGGLRTLIIETGLFTVPEHVQNSPATAHKKAILARTDRSRDRRSVEN